MAERSREKPGSDLEATIFAPPKPRPERPEPIAPPPSSERTQMYIAPDSPSAVVTGGGGPQGLGPTPPNMPAPPPRRGPNSSPGSMPPPGYAPPKMPTSTIAMAMPGSQAPGMMPGSQAPGMMPGSHGMMPGSQGGMMPGSMPGSQGGPMPGSQGMMPGSQPPQNSQGMVHVDPRRMAQTPPTGGAAFRPAPAVITPPPSVLLQGKPDPRLILITEPDSARAVSFRLLRDNLLAKRLPRVLAVSSAAKKDGKTTCALNLSLSLSEGAKVLLIDGNLLDPELSKIFCIPDNTPPWPPVAPWLAPYRIVEFSRSLHVAGVVLPPGQVPPRFEKQWFDLLIGSLRRFPYDFIIVDAAALSVSPTVAQLVATADATLLAVRSGVTTARALRRATDQIPEGKGIGVALIDATLR